GYYLLTYQKGEDESMNRPVPVEVRSHLYEDYNANINIGEADLEYDFNLVYAAPVFISAYLTNNRISVKIMDYQGFNDISEVKGIFSIALIDGEYIGYLMTETIDFIKSNNISFTEGEYRLNISYSWINYNPKDGKNRCKFVMIDQGGHCDTTQFLEIQNFTPFGE
ncbi:MAG: hypothetical protein KAR38_00920, partial [Calditrichia bacterium]|nr:hypothetical protein [Calditrichia bacterium]